MTQEEIRLRLLELVVNNKIGVEIDNTNRGACRLAECFLAWVNGSSVADMFTDTPTSVHDAIQAAMP
jgi:hypothetical protein